MENSLPPSSLGLRVIARLHKKERRGESSAMGISRAGECTHARSLMVCCYPALLLAAVRLVLFLIYELNLVIGLYIQEDAQSMSLQGSLLSLLSAICRGSWNLSLRITALSSLPSAFGCLELPWCHQLGPKSESLVPPAS